MTCYHPIKILNKKALPPESGDALPYGTNVISVPCGRCIGCRLDRSKMWAMRCVHESLLHTRNCFITLTYNDDWLINRCGMGESYKDGFSLNKRDFVLFMKKMRNNYGRMRFFHCGEYGEQFERPHHHACIFGFDFADKRHWSTRNGIKLFVSNELESTWGYGHCIVGEVTFDSAAYVARYITKKINGDMADKWYDGREPEYCTMSRKPGIGKEYLIKYQNDIYRNDMVKLLKGLTLRPGRYYDSIYAVDHENELNKLKLERIKSIDKIETTRRRLLTKEVVQTAKFNVGRRGFENGI